MVLWGSWAVIDDRGRSFWFAGDTAYADVFQQIGNRFGGFDLAAIPIGDFTFTAICKAFKGAQSPNLSAYIGSCGYSGP